MQSSPTASCYGRYFDRLDQCDGCPEHAWCQTAGDPKPLTGPVPGVYGMGDADYDRAYHTAQPSPPRHDGNDTTVFSAAIRGILDACRYRPALIATALLRLDGMSYETIAKLLDPPRTRPMIKKYIDAIAKVNPELGALVRQRRPQHADPRSLNVRIYTAHQERRPYWIGRLTGPGGLYHALAVEFGVESWNKARQRIWTQMRSLRRVNAARADGPKSAVRPTGGTSAGSSRRRVG
jgi:hypothetical protein